MPVRKFYSQKYSFLTMHRSSAQWRISNSLLLATIIRVGFVVITYGCKVPAGIFVPSMAIGATFGRMVGIVVKAMYTSVSAGYSTDNATHSSHPEHTHILGYSNFVLQMYHVSHRERMLSWERQQLLGEY